MGKLHVGKHSNNDSPRRKEREKGKKYHTKRKGREKILHKSWDNVDIQVQEEKITQRHM